MYEPMICSPSDSTQHSELEQDGRASSAMLTTLAMQKPTARILPSEPSIRYVVFPLPMTAFLGCEPSVDVTCKP